QITRFGWKHGASTQLHDQIEIANDPGLAPLKEAFYSGSSATDDPRGKQFAERMFSDPSSFLSEQRAEQPKVFTPSEIHGNRATFLYWRTEFQPAKVRTFEEARAQVEAAWRLEKARKLARAEADKIAEQAQKTKGDAVRTLTEESIRFGGKLTALDGIS